MVNASNPIPTGERVRASEYGRRCKYNGCKTILSIYNHGNYCSIHWKIVEDELDRAKKYGLKKKGV